MSTLRLILGDQLNKNIATLKGCDKKNDVVLLCEVISEATYVKHHKKKIVLIFSAMRHFREELIKSHYNVEYVKLDDIKNSGCFSGEAIRICKKHKLKSITVTKPGEYRVLQELQSIYKQKDIQLTLLEDDRFLCSSTEFTTWTNDRKQLRMENFYRFMRIKHDILMEGKKPVGGKWNYDKENRKVPKKQPNIPHPARFNIDPITEEVINLVIANFSDHFGDLSSFTFAVTRKQALLAFNKFVKERLSLFGDYQDAMLQDEPYLYHSLISFYLNIGLLLPREVIKKVEDAYLEKLIPLNAAEGFIRQILGWREYVRGVYWHKMPEYKNNNYFNARNKLPSFFWTGNTKLNCLRQCIEETKENAYAHHIQRLMVLGNFSLLTGIDPAKVNEWYLIVYADAFEWVELPNVTGMILYADGGILASKPYASGGAYINRMSDYCKNCDYNVKEKIGENACPFNYLYWNFLDKNSNKLRNNQRLAMVYRTLKNMESNKRAQIRVDAKKFIAEFD